MIHSFIPDIYKAPLQETYSFQLWPSRNVLRSLQKTSCSGAPSTMLEGVHSKWMGQ